jgi:ABC-type multidrug transport system ATPase subunit
MVIINKGTTVVEGNVKELLSTDILKVVFEVSDAQKSLSILQKHNRGNNIDSVSDNKVILNLEQNEISEINKKLVEGGVAVSAVLPKRSLEEYFLKITSEAN